jgi:nitrate reductase NapE component
MFKKKTKRKNHLDFLRAYEDIEHKIEDWIEEFPGAKKRSRRKRSFKFLKFLAYFCLIIVLAVAVAGSFVLGDLWQTYNFSISGQKRLQASIDNIYSYDFARASVEASGAKEDLRVALRSAEDLHNNFLISKIQYTDRQLQSLEHLLRAGVMLGEVINKGAYLGEQINTELNRSYSDDFNFNALSSEERRGILRIMYENSPAVKGIAGNLQLASAEMERVQPAGFLKLYEDEIGKMREKTTIALEMTAKADHLCKLIPHLAGYPNDSNFLLILQNSDELRPSGGFVGTYGLIVTKDAGFKRLETHDIYHLDMPVQDKMDITPPLPIKRYLNEQWFMRDANWSPHWPDSARQLLWFYHKEDQLLPKRDQINNFYGDFDGVIGITPAFVEELLAITGPIAIEGVEYNKDNFTDLLQYRVEKGYVQLGEPSWQRKEVIGEILKELKARLFQVQLNRWRDIVDVFQDNSGRKNILLYLEDEYLQNIVREIGVDGRVRQASRDYLMVVDSNMGARKTDAVMSKSVHYKLQEAEDGLYVDLNVNYSHSGGIDWRTSDYKTYTRIYVPQGAELLSLSNNGKEQAGSVAIGQEYGKTVFGTFLTVEAGGIGSLQASYKLPDHILQAVDEQGYQLYFQKQPANKLDNIVVDVELGDKVKSYNPVGFYADKVNDSRIRWTGELQRDRRFELRIKN